MEYYLLEKKVGKVKGLEEKNMEKLFLQTNDDELWQASTWYNALSLTERVARGRACPQDILTKDQEHVGRATQLLNTWKAQPPFDHGAFFAERLASDSLTEEDFLAFLAESVAEVKVHTPSTPDWLTTFRGAFSEACDVDKVLPISQEIRENYHLGPFLQTIRPLVLYGFTSLQKGIQALQQRYSFQPFDEQQVCQSFLNNLLPQLLSQIGKTIILEMHVARRQGHLQGETPEERFTDFARQLSQKERSLSLFAEYPVLARLLVSTIDLWAKYALETLDHLCADWSDIRTVLTPGNDPGLLVEVQDEAGDKHREGRSVQILTFSSGLKLVYKPKPLAIDKHFQELLTWLNERGAQPPLRTLKLLDCGAYGWTEFVKATSCISQDELVRFYERQGEYLALFYALNATDCHSENVIASGEHPMPIDLESLFHPHTNDDASTQPGDIALSFINQSVLRVGLLPNRSWSSKDSPGVDISGLGGRPGQIMPHLLPGWDEVRTDQMHLTLQPSETPAHHNRPRLNDCDVHVLDYKNDIARGFTSMYRLLMNVRDVLLTEQLPLFAHDEVRVLIRMTRFYSLLLAASFHPDLLRDALERDRFFDRLWLGVESWPDLSKFIPAERQALLRGDIPLFTTFPGGCMVFTSDGEPVMDLYKRSGLDLAQRQIQRLGEPDLTQQLWIIKASLATLEMGLDDKGAYIFPMDSLHSTPQPVNREQLIALAKAIGMRLEELALQNDESATWFCLDLLLEKTWGLTFTGIDSYEGVNGIILFLAHLGAITDEARFTSLAKLAFAPIRKQFSSLHVLIKDLEKEPPGISIGAFEGWGSLLYLLIHLSVLWHEPALVHEAEELIELLPELISRDEHFDILSGSAGCILSLLSFYAIHPSPRVLEIAIQCGDHLLVTAQTMPAGTAWVTIKDEQPLGGFSHGSAGIALSLLQLADVSGEERFRQTALAALAYDRSLFLPAQQNWADLRVDPATKNSETKEAEQPGVITPEKRQLCMIAWCHGASGIGLGRLGSLKLMDDAQVREEIDIALNTTMGQGLAGNHSLCHGAFGNVELLLTAAHLLNRPEDHERLERALAIIVESIETHGWVTGIPLGMETPGLMTGLAGMGYELLRLAEPDKVPSVLLVAPPVCKEKP
jgi:type 2 lantibiotic biosynthesis protein LanM